ncbi:RlpA-like double-psi beta-barrel-protein domain-containing protein-containing protein [Gongronella butleri]|nr:RlpA-like double-psi beta-barrel-protein domain-containing protein-containing protein [Gongronella butleri]
MALHKLFLMMVSMALLLVAVHGAPMNLARRGGAESSGKATYYNTGLGSCGKTNTDTQLVVALSASDMKKSYCGKKIKVMYHGKSVLATVVDTCPGCASGSIDLSPAAFKALGNLAAGVLAVKWDFA